MGQECGSILAYSQLDNKHMTRDPVIPCPPNHMKVMGKEGLPRFNAQSLGEWFGIIPSSTLINLSKNASYSRIINMQRSSSSHYYIHYIYSWLSLLSLSDQDRRQ